MINDRFSENDPSPNGGKINQDYRPVSGSSFASPNNSTSCSKTNRALITHNPRLISARIQARYLRQEQIAALEEKGSYQVTVLRSSAKEERL